MRTVPATARGLTALALALTLGLTLLTGGARTARADEPQAQLSAEDRAALVEALERTWADVRKEVDGLSAEQLAFKPAPDRWSVAQVVEHLVRAEALLRDKVVASALASTPRTQEEMTKYPPVHDAAIWLATTNRSRKFPAPTELQPTGEWSQEEGGDHTFAAARTKTLEFVRTTQADLRSHYAPHPLFGAIDACQWLIAIAAHTDRHLEQIREVKASPGFPAA